MNTAGISYVSEYDDFSEFNLSKHQNKYSHGDIIEGESDAQGV